MSTITVLLVVGCYVVIREFAIELAHAIRSRRRSAEAAPAPVAMPISPISPL
jgi:hypothetical protein